MGIEATDIRPAAIEVVRREQPSNKRQTQAEAIVIFLAVASAVGAALAGAHPTGTPGVDQFYAAAVGAAFVVAASMARRSTLIIAAAIAFALSRSWLWLPSAAALGLAFSTAFQRRAHRRLGALIGAITVQVMMRWPSVGAHGVTALVGVGVFVMVAANGWTNAGRRTRRRIAVGLGIGAGLLVLFTLPVLLSALLARGPAGQGVALARSSIDLLESSQSTAATDQLRTSAADLRSARQDVGGFWNLGGYLIPVVAQQQRALDRGTKAGQSVSAAAVRDSASFDFSSLRYHDGHIDLAALTALRPKVVDLDSAVRGAAADLRGSRSSWLVAPLAQKVTSLSNSVDRAERGADLAVAGINSAPGILGGDGPRTYVVVFMTPAETRGLGGFIGAYGVLRADQGSIRLLKSGSTSDFATITSAHPNLVDLTGLPDYKARYGTFEPQNHFQDVSYSPDMPTVERVIGQMFPALGGQAIDGVLVVDPDSLAALLNFTGPITVPGFPAPLTSANAADILLRGQYLLTSISDQRHDLLQAALTTGFTHLVSGSLPSPKALATALGPEVREGRMLFWTSHASDQTFLRQVGLSGAFPTPGRSSDLIAITDANGTNNKIDAYLHQQVSDAVVFDPHTGQVRATLTIQLHNSAPDNGMPYYVIADNAGSGLPDGTSYTWLSLYTPLKVRSATLDGQRVSLSVPISELGQEAYSVFVLTPSAGTSTLVISLEGTVKRGPTYQMNVRLQPLANPQSLNVTVQPTSGWFNRPTSPVSWVAEDNEVQAHTWSFSR